MVRGSPRGIVAYVPICEFVVREFELGSLYYARLKTYSLGKVMNFLIPSLLG